MDAEFGPRGPAPRDLALCGLLGAAALLLPTLFHLVRLGHVFMPMYLPLMVLAFLVPPAAVAATALLIPLVSALLTGMPPWYPPIAPSMALELSLMGATASWLWRRWPGRGAVVGPRVLLVLVPVLLMGRLFQFAFGWGVALLMGLPPAVLSVAALLSGLPGLVLMIVVVPVVVQIAHGDGGGHESIDLRGWFDQRAGGWEGMMPVERMQRELTAGLVCLGVEPQEQVLDAGCGTGLLIGVLRRHLGPSGTIQGVDFSAAMIEQARLRHGDDPRVRLHRAEASAVPLPDGSIDRVICFAAWPHFREPRRVIREWRRLLRPGGNLHVWHIDGRETINRIHHQAGGAVAGDRLEPAARLARRLRREGLEVVEILDTADHYRVGARRRSRR